MDIITDAWFWILCWVDVIRVWFVENLSQVIITVLVIGITWLITRWYYIKKERRRGNSG
jgi:hypothetical protein